MIFLRARDGLIEVLRDDTVKRPQFRTEVHFSEVPIGIREEAENFFSNYKEAEAAVISERSNGSYMATWYIAY